MPREKLSYSQQTCIKKSGLLLQKLNALQPGSRIGVAVSGGVDSFTLLKVMKIRLGILPFKCELLALHINPGFKKDEHRDLLEWLGKEGIGAHIELADFGPKAHGEENRKKSPCFLCAWHRRKMLFELCRKYRLTHLALGHNADDLLATFLLNFCRNANVSGLSAKEQFFNGALCLIRPFLLVEKKYIRQAARQWRLPVWENACPSSGKTARSQTNDIVNSISMHASGARRSMLNALLRWQMKQDLQ